MNLNFYKLKILEIEIQKRFNKSVELKVLLDKNFLTKEEFKKEIKKINKEIIKLEKEICELNNLDYYLYRYKEFENPICTCPKLDNKALVGISTNRWYNNECLIHGESNEELKK